MPKATKGGKPKKSELPRANPITKSGRCFDVSARSTMLQDSRAIGLAAMDIRIVVGRWFGVTPFLDATGAIALQGAA